ncbi:hypothetical protein SteCoe_27829 [Stentor coeruleus]|uniref:Uncharacterized protein n=1 Tax=Stentor coeruleus TaxID=5963 RepID=A0A1R2B9M3_9CILI|nr:hypothetical protein SteCoe_27829 [Stentor coeruleus]
METGESDVFDYSDLPHNFLEKRFSPLTVNLNNQYQVKQDTVNSNRGSSFDIEECMNNMNSMSNVNPRFAVEIDFLTLNYSRN